MYAGGVEGAGVMMCCMKVNKDAIRRLGGRDRIIIVK